jgi:hypothetical protein
MTSAPSAIKPEPVAAAALAGRRWEVAAWLALTAVLVALTPLFLCMPLTVDTTFYDICGQDILRGRSPEKDFLVLMPPAMAWALAAVRATLGGSSLAFRAADLLVVGAVIGLLAGWLRSAGASRAAAVWSAVMLSTFYLTTTEWCQVQPDSWMLLPSVAALHLRRRQVAILAAPGHAGRVAVRGALEGLLWGAGCLVKPYVVVPGVLAWLVSVLLVRGAVPEWRGRVVRDAAGLMAGGLIMAVGWQGWLLKHDAWHTYWHNVAEFRGDYYSRSSPLVERLERLLLENLFPWGLVHLAAAPLALVSLLGAALGSGRGAAAGVARAEALLAGVYLGWTAQATYKQSQLDYQLVPAVLLGMTLVATVVACRLRRVWGGLALAVFSAVAVWYQAPFVRPQRMALWAECWRQGSTPELQDRLHMARFTPTEAELQRVTEFLLAERVGDQDVLCFGFTTTPVQASLGTLPATRHLYPNINMAFFADHREAIRSELKSGRQRFIITDACDLGLTSAQAAVERPGDPLALPPLPPGSPGEQSAREWPYAEPVVFRAGRYYVHQAAARG